MDQAYDKSQAQQDLARRRDLPVEDGVYRHYKGGLYTVRAVSIKEDTGEIMVTYTSNRTGQRWTRTLDDWEQKVPRPGATADPGSTRELIPRFLRETS
jgi:hypothetical protein